MTDSIPMKEFENLTVNISLPMEWNSEKNIGITDFCQTQKFTFDTNTVNHFVPERPQLDPGEYNIRLRRTMFYCENHPEDGETLLHNAILAGNETLALCMLEDMVSYKHISVKNLFQETPLHVAVMSNMPKVVRRIMVHGGEVCVPNKNGDTPLHLACRKGLQTCVEILTKHLKYEEIKDIPYQVPFRLIPQNLELRNYEGLTCLHLATINNHINIVNYLVKTLYASVDTQEGKSGKTALHFAVELGFAELVNFLVMNCGANVNAEMYNRRTALDIAVEKNMTDIERTLAVFGGRFSDVDEEVD